MESVDPQVSPSCNCVLQAQGLETENNALLQTIWSFSIAAVRIIISIMGYLASPLSYIFGIILSIITAIFSPFLQLARVFLSISLAPLRLVAKGEMLYVFFSWAVLVGVFSGLFFFSANRVIGESLHAPASSAIVSKQELREQSNKDGKLAEKEGKEEEEEEDTPSPGFFAHWANHDMTRREDRGLLSTKILEEEDDNHEYD